MMAKSKFMRAVNWILNILIVIFLIIVIYMFLARIFGSSPTDLELISAIFGLFGTAVLKLFNLDYALNREVGELKIGVKSGFKRTKEDIGSINDRLDKFSESIQNIKLNLRKGKD